jgi:hypothetical protein
MRPPFRQAARLPPPFSQRRRSLPGFLREQFRLIRKLNPRPQASPRPIRTRQPRVKSNSLGLALQFDEMPGSMKPYELDDKNGILKFNVRHPYFEQCEKRERWLRQYQTYVALQALVIQSMAEDQRQIALLGFTDMLALVVDTILMTDPMSGRIKVVKAKKA